VLTKNSKDFAVIRDKVDFEFENINWSFGANPSGGCESQLYRLPQCCIKKVAKRVKTIMDKGQSEDQGHFW
jgi:hypothetical protein